MEIITNHLKLRPFNMDDYQFIQILTNQPAFLQYIGDKKIVDKISAQKYLTDGPLKSYVTHGYGLMGVELRSSGVLIGMCGLLKRSFLPDPDLGFAFLREFRRKGYAYESSNGILRHEFDQNRLKRVMAITDPDNIPSINLLLKLGFVPAPPVNDEKGNNLLCFALRLGHGSI